MFPPKKKSAKQVKAIKAKGKKGKGKPPMGVAARIGETMMQPY
jgi:hypothetical protein